MFFFYSVEGLGNSFKYQIVLRCKRLKRVLHGLGPIAVGVTEGSWFVMYAIGDLLFSVRLH